MKTTKLVSVIIALLMLLTACADDSVPANAYISGESSGSAATEPMETEGTTTAQTVAASPTPINESIDYAAFDSRIKEIASSLGAVGMGLSVFANGEVIYSTSYGYADRELGIPADSDTVYRAASVSKLVSTMVLTTLYDDGVLTPYSELEPLTGISYNDPALDKPVLLWHLLTHTSGLMDSEAYIESYQYLTDLETVMSCSHSGSVPGTSYNYCNLGAGTIGAIVEKLTGEFFHDYADRVFFKPMGMDAAYCADLLAARENAANLYLNDALSNTPKTWGRITDYYELYGLGNSYHTAQAELMITTPDLARLGVILAGDGSLNGVRVLSSEAVGLINTTFFSDKGMDFDMGLTVRKHNGNLVEGRTIYGHPGQSLGSINGLYYDPADGTGVAICSVGCSSSVNESNGVYTLLDKCVKEVYRVFFD